MASSSAEASAPATDEDLVEAILGGDESAFEALYERYFPRIYRFVDRRTRNRSDTEELTQEVFANLFASLSSFRREAPFAAWVFGATRPHPGRRQQRPDLRAAALLSPSPHPEPLHPGDRPAGGQERRCGEVPLVSRAKGSAGPLASAVRRRRAARAARRS